MKPKTLSAAALVVAAALAPAACTAGRPGRSAQQGVEAVKAARTMDELGKTLQLTVPDGYTQVPDNLDDTGPSDLEKAVSDDGNPDARDVLTRDHFVRGYQREWAMGRDDQVISYVYQFADDAGAAAYTRRITEDSGAPGDGRGTGTFTVPAIDGAVGVNSTDANFPSSTVTFAKGPYSVQVVVNAATPDGLQSLATSLAEEQADRL